MHRIALLAGAALVAFSIEGATPAQAQLSVVCPTCSSAFEQLVSDAKQAQQYLTQLQQLQTELQSYANMVQNSLALPMSIWSQVQGDINQVQNLSNLASLLSGNSGGIISRLNSLQSAGYQLSSVGGNLENLPQQFTMWQNTIGNSSQQLGRALGVQQNDLNNQTAIQTAIQAHSSSAAGQMQAIQAGTEMAANNGALLQQINQTLIATAQSQQTSTEVNADRRATEDAAELHFSTLQSTQTTGWTGF